MKEKNKKYIWEQEELDVVRELAAKGMSGAQILEHHFPVIPGKPLPKEYHINYRIKVLQKTDGGFPLKFIPMFFKRKKKKSFLHPKRSLRRRGSKKTLVLVRIQYNLVFWSHY